MSGGSEILCVWEVDMNLDWLFFWRKPKEALPTAPEPQEEPPTQIAFFDLQKQVEKLGAGDYTFQVTDLKPRQDDALKSKVAELGGEADFHKNFIVTITIPEKEGNDE